VSHNWPLDRRPLTARDIRLRLEAIGVDSAEATETAAWIILRGVVKPLTWDELKQLLERDR
jgi:hypothetical protein